MQNPGPWLAAAFAFLLSIPHLHWLVASDFMPVTYAENRAYHMNGLERLAGIGKFVGSQAITFLAPVAVLAVLQPGLRKPATVPGGRLFVDVLAWAPLGGMVVFSLVTGGAMLEMWGMPAIIWIPLALAMRLRPVMEARNFRLARNLWIGLFVAAPLINGIYCYSMPYWGAMPFSSGLPGRQLAEKTTAIWQETVGGTPKIVAGDTLAAGVIHYFTPGNPQGFMETDYRFNLGSHPKPWRVTVPCLSGRDQQMLTMPLAPFPPAGRDRTAAGQRNHPYVLCHSRTGKAVMHNHDMLLSRRAIS